MYAMTLTEVRANLNTAQTSGSILLLILTKMRPSILSTKLTIDNTEKTSQQHQHRLLLVMVISG